MLFYVAQTCYPTAQLGAKLLSLFKVPLVRKRTPHPAPRDRRAIKTKLRSAELLSQGAQLFAWVSQIEGGLQPATAWIAGYSGSLPGLC